VAQLANCILLHNLFTCNWWLPPTRAQTKLHYKLTHRTSVILFLIINEEQ